MTFYNNSTKKREREVVAVSHPLFLIREFYNILLKYDLGIGSSVFEILPRKMSCFHVGVLVHNPLLAGLLQMM